MAFRSGPLTKGVPSAPATQRNPAAGRQATNHPFVSKCLKRRFSVGCGQHAEEVFTPRVGVSFLGASAKNIPLESPGKGKGEVFTLGLPYPCSQRPKKRELSPAATVPPPLQRLVAPVPWNLTPAYFQGNQ